MGCVEPLLDMLNLNLCKIGPLLPVGRFINIDPSPSGLLISWTLGPSPSVFMNQLQLSSIIANNI